MPARVGQDDSPPPHDERPTRRLLFAIIATVLVGGFAALLVVGLKAGEVDRSIDNAIARGQLKAAPDFTLPVLANGSPLKEA
jgi:hypothetical protein